VAAYTPAPTKPHLRDNKGRSDPSPHGTIPLVASSASLDLVELLVVANVGQDYRDPANAGQAQIDAARPTTRPA
jgi:hypothetical protein